MVCRCVKFFVVFEIVSAIFVKMLVCHLLFLPPVSSREYWDLLWKANIQKLQGDDPGLLAEVKIIGCW